MEKCIICGRNIKSTTHFLIQSRGKEINFYSSDCVEKYISNAESSSLIDYELNKRNFKNEDNSGLLNIQRNKPRIFNTLLMEN